MRKKFDLKNLNVRVIPRINKNVTKIQFEVNLIRQKLKTTS